MQNKRIYLDQNIIGYIRDGLINFSKLKGIDWVYSEEHFREISRSDNPRIYLSVLEKLKAQEVKLILDSSFKITGYAQFYDYSSPYEKFEQFIDTTEEVDFDVNIFAPFIARCSGADNYEEVLKSPDIFENAIEGLFNSVGIFDKDITKYFKEPMREFGEFIVQHLEDSHSLEDIRKGLGVHKGKVGQVPKVDSIREIWKLLEKQHDIIKGMSCDQFFGFDPIDKQGYDSWPLYLAISSCYSMLNILGYRTDNGVAKQEKVPNIASDAGHIAYAAYCDAFMSADQKLCDKASAIYDYKNVGTKIFRVKIIKNG